MFRARSSACLVEERMKNICLALVLAGVMAGCATPGAYDSRMASLPETIYTIDGYPIYVKTLRIESEPGVYDVQAGDNRVISFTGLNEPLALQARLRKAAMNEMRRIHGEKATITEIAANTPGGGVQMIFLRYSVSDSKAK